MFNDRNILFQRILKLAEVPQQTPAPERVEAAALARLGVVILAVAVLTNQFGGIVGQQ